MLGLSRKGLFLKRRRRGLVSGQDQPGAADRARQRLPPHRRRPPRRVGAERRGPRARASRASSLSLEKHYWSLRRGGHRPARTTGSSRHYSMRRLGVARSRDGRPAPGRSRGSPGPPIPRGPRRAPGTRSRRRGGASCRGRSWASADRGRGKGQSPRAWARARVSGAAWPFTITEAAPPSRSASSSALTLPASACADRARISHGRSASKGRREAAGGASAAA